MTMQPNCAECDQPLPWSGSADVLRVVELLDLRGDLASLDPSATRLGFCDRGVELASSIHVAAHNGGVAPHLRRKTKRWLREANERLDMWQVAGSAPVSQIQPQPAGQRLSA